MNTFLLFFSKGVKKVNRHRHKVIRPITTVKLNGILKIRVVG